ncbi:hypothetical protein B0I08_106304 [Glaciihabitans tibetensis]|uniref:Uncharacterized protein n=2 Tax=Glaciihabitans tibetensis TaxID=1266600 RepID=A0A2T0VBX9_9MICO|nr:hypothetical protein B0I08_106304 [Glaciihabitans tibetensis]
MSGKAFARRIKRESAIIRSSFLGPSLLENQPSPVARLLRGGRGGGVVKIKLLISILWIAVSEPYDVSFSARTWATLLGLSEPETKGASRVNAALRRLVEQQFLDSEPSPGLPPRLRLLEETGRGRPYIPPGKVLVEARQKEIDALDENRYFKVPNEIWTNGWIARLSGPGFVMLLVLLDLASGRKPTNLWLSPKQAERRYQLSDETRSKGFDELVELGIASVQLRLIQRDLTQSPYRRNVYTLHLEKLNESPPK